MIEIAVNAEDSIENSRLSKTQIIDVRISFPPFDQTDWIDLSFF